MEHKFNIGDVVRNKAEITSNRKLEMTIHCFATDATGTRLSITKEEWVLCKWLDTNTLTYQETCFHINELHKVG